MIEKTEQTIDLMIQMSILDRVSVKGLMPKEANLIELTLMRDILKKTDLTQEEYIRFGITARPAHQGGGLQWLDKNNEDTPVTFTSMEMEFLKSRIVELDRLKKLDSDVLSLCLKIREIKTDKE
jgi:hypothetical protein